MAEPEPPDPLLLRYNKQMFADLNRILNRPDPDTADATVLSDIYTSSPQFLFFLFLFLVVMLFF